MKLSELLIDCEVISIRGDENIEVLNISSDSREVKEGSAFVAIEGIRTDGHAYISKAIEMEASVIIYDKPMIDDYFSRVTYVRVPDSSIALAQIAAKWFDYPSSKLKLVGITGTNGKTTTATLLYDVFKKQGYAVGLLSTVCNYVNDVKYETSHTTLESIPLNSLLHEMVEAGCEYAFMEVSSHAIHQKRTYGLTFSGGVFSNLTQDHLDYHKNMSEYLAVKKSFFDNLPEDSFALTNVDDKNGKVMLQNCPSSIKRSYSIKKMGDFKAKVIEKHFYGTDIEIDGRELSVSFIGTFNIYNLLAVYGTAFLLGLDKDTVLRLLTSLTSVSGRFETIASPKGYTVIVDYAHTPDALTNVLEAIAEILDNKGEIITVVGCGGNRDNTKRAIMAREAVKGSSKSIFTMDNPRHEDPKKIIEEMIEGLTPSQVQETLVILDRKEAIKTACSFGKEGDIILIAGKGHENYQDIKGVKSHFDDREVVKDIIEMQKNN